MKIWRGLIKQNGTDAPTAIVLENTLGGDIAWVRINRGLYAGVLAGAFPREKTLVRISNTTGFDADCCLEVTTQTATGDVFSFYSRFGGSESDDMLDMTPVEILVYD